MAGNLTNMIASIFSGSAVTADPYYEYTTLLLPGSGTNGAQNNTFLDASTNNFTITRNGNTTQGTFSPFSQTGWGNYFSGSSQYLSVADSTAFTIGTGDFTVEYWVYWNGTSSTFRAYGQVDSGGSSASISIRGGIDASNKVINGAFSGTTDYLCTSTASLVANTWNHIAFVRDGTTLRQYINGGQDGTASISTASVNDSSSQFAIGRAGEFNGNYFGGYISNFRLVKGRCVYPSGTSFTPPTSPLTRTTGGTNPPQGTETSLLTCQSNRFLDSNGPNTPASSPITITPSGSPSVQAFSPFNPTASWSAATNGGSGYFDGNGDALSISSQVALGFGTGDFCTEFWAYRQNQVNYQVIFQLNTYNNGLYIRAEAPQYSDSFYFVGVSYNWDPATNFKLNSWTHFCITRQSGTLRFLTNGKLIVNATNTNNMGAATADIGAAGYLGYLSGVRIVKGSVPSEYQTSITTVGTQVFNPPTAPPTNVTDTQLLLNFTNAGIYDATSKNDLETVGNAQIVAPTPTKWGGGSMAFDGTTDYLVEPTSVYFGYGTGDFTIEFWVYFNSTGTSTIFSNLSGTASTNPHIYINSTIRFYNGGGDRITSSTSPSTGVWYHLAVCRASGSTRMFLDGTQTGATYADTNDYGQSAPLGVGTYWNGGAPVTASTLNGYLQDVRVSKYARYTTNFTPPTAAFPTL